MVLDAREGRKQRVFVFCIGLTSKFFRFEYLDTPLIYRALISSIAYVAPRRSLLDV